MTDNTNPVIVDTDIEFEKKDTDKSSWWSRPVAYVRRNKTTLAFIGGCIATLAAAAGLRSLCEDDDEDEDHEEYDTGDSYLLPDDGVYETDQGLVTVSTED